MHIEAFLFGLTLAVSIGPIALLILNTSVNRGTAAGLACGAGAASADFTFALIAFTAGAGLLAILDANRQLIAIFAAALLCVLGAWLLTEAWRQRKKSIQRPAPAGPGFVTTYLLTLANPLTILFFAAWIGSQQTNVAWTTILTISLAVFTGSFIVQAGLAFGGGSLRGLLSPRVLLAANALSGIGILGFGIFRFTRL